MSESVEKSADDEEPICLCCNQPFFIRPGFERSDYCDSCAQELAVEFRGLVKEIFDMPIIPGTPQPSDDEWKAVGDWHKKAKGSLAKSGIES